MKPFGKAESIALLSLLVMLNFQFALAAMEASKASQQRMAAYVVFFDFGKTSGKELSLLMATY